MDIKQKLETYTNKELLQHYKYIKKRLICLESHNKNYTKLQYNTIVELLDYITITEG